jgi:hypothetical protein
VARPESAVVPRSCRHWHLPRWHSAE